MDRQTAIKIQNELSASVKAVFQKYKLEITKNRASYNPTEIKFTASACEAGIASVVNSNLLSQIGIVIGQEFNYGDKTYKVASVKQGRGITWVHAARQPDGKIFRIKSSIVQQLTNKKPKRSESEIMEELRNIEVALSPENLHMDGEAPSYWVKE